MVSNDNGKIDYEKFNNWYDNVVGFGFNNIVDIDLHVNEKGLIPNYNYLKNNKKIAIGEILNLAIGQGDIKVTPLQVIHFINIVSNRGKTYFPHVNKNIEKPKVAEVDYDESTWDQIHNSMYNTVNGTKGTAKRAQINNSTCKVFGKTGTAEKNGAEPDAWFVGWLEYNDKKYTICVIIENGGKGSVVPSIFARKIFEFIIDIDNNV